MAFDVNVVVFSISAQVIHCDIKDRHGCTSCFFSAIYGLNSIDTRKSLWEEILRLNGATATFPWLISGDFNAVLSSDDRINGNPVTTLE